ncbi:hypothetical protein ENH_00076340, partial [Eimeria necatrix]
GAAREGAGGFEV